MWSGDQVVIEIGLRSEEPVAGLTIVTRAFLLQVCEEGSMRHEDIDACMATYVVVKLAMLDEVVDVAKDFAAKLAIVVITALNALLAKSFFLPKCLEWML